MRLHGANVPGRHQIMQRTTPRIAGAWQVAGSKLSIGRWTGSAGAEGLIYTCDMSRRSLDDVSAALAQENGLVTVATQKADGRPLLSVVNAGVLRHPASGEHVVGFVVRGSSAKRRHLAERPAVAVLARRGWQWVAVEGDAELVGPLNPHPGLDAAAVAALLREIFVAAGGTHDDWSEYDRVMAVEERTAVLVTPTRIFGPG